MLNNIRIAILDDHTAILKSKFVGPTIANLQSDAINIFAKNAPADRHNLVKLEVVDSLLHNISCIDLISKNVSPQKIEEVLNCNQSNTGRLAKLLHIKVMLTVNIYVKDKNRQLNGMLKCS